MVVEVLEQLADRLNEAHQTAAAGRFLQKAEELCRLYVDQRPQGCPHAGRLPARRDGIQEALDLVDAKWTLCDSSLAWPRP